MNTEIKSAEEKAENFFYDLRIEGILPPFDAVNKRKFIERLAAQFTPAIVGDGVEKAAEKYYWEQKSKKRTMGVYHAVEDFKAGWKAAQEQPIKSVPDETFSASDYQDGKCTIDQLIESDKRIEQEDKIDKAIGWCDEELEKVIKVGKDLNVNTVMLEQHYIKFKQYLQQLKSK